MKFVLLLTRGEWQDTAPEAEREQVYARIG